MIQLCEIMIVGENKLVVYQETTCHSSLIFDGDLTVSENMHSYQYGADFRPFDAVSLYI